MTLNEMYSYDSIGSLMKDRRKELNLTQNDVADQLGISAKALSKIETGHNSLSFEHLPVLKKVLKIPEPVLKDIACKSFVSEDDDSTEIYEEILVDVTEQAIENTISTLKRNFWRQREYPPQPDDEMRYDIQRVIDDLRYRMDKDGRVLEKYKATASELDLICHIHNYLGADLRKGFDTHLFEALRAVLDCKKYYKEDFDPTLDASWTGPTYPSKLRSSERDGRISDKDFEPIERRIRDELSFLQNQIVDTKSRIFEIIRCMDDASCFLLSAMLSYTKYNMCDRWKVRIRNTFNRLKEVDCFLDEFMCFIVEGENGEDVSVVLTGEDQLECMILGFPRIYVGDTPLTQKKRAEIWKDDVAIKELIKDSSLVKGTAETYSLYKKYKVFSPRIRARAFDTAFEIFRKASMGGKHEVVTIDEIESMIKAVDKERAS